MATGSDVDRDPEFPRVGQHIDRFLLEAELGSGTFGKVFRAIDQSSSGIVAVKVLRPASFEMPERVCLFAREINVHASFCHPFIVQFYCSGAIGDRYPWFAMEYVPGRDLKKLVERADGKLSVLDACSIVNQLLIALDFAHRFPPPRGPFVHRDVKPQNVLIVGERHQYHVKLTDFGLAKNFETAGLSDMTLTGTARGSVEFMPPEQAYDSKYAGPEVDLYACGAVLYYALCGSHMYAFRGDEGLSVRVNHVLQRLIVPIHRRRSDVPAGLVEIIERATALDRVRRFRTAHQMSLALQEFLTSAPGRPGT